MVTAWPKTSLHHNAMKCFQQRLRPSSAPLIEKLRIMFPNPDTASPCLPPIPTNSGSTQNLHIPNTPLGKSHQSASSHTHPPPKSGRLTVRASIFRVILHPNPVNSNVSRYLYKTSREPKPSITKHSHPRP